jgi:hypothetical protein
LLKTRSKVNGAACSPESHCSAALSSDVVEWKLCTQTQCTVVPRVIVVVVLPLTESTNWLPPCPTETLWTPPAGGVGVTVGAGEVGVGVGFPPPACSSRPA